jgi:hypothetical protein
MMEAILVLTILVLTGATIGYLGSRSRAGAKFLVSLAFTVSGISLYHVSSSCIQADTMIEIVQYSQSSDSPLHFIGPAPSNPYAWLAHWGEPYFLMFGGGLLALFGTGACLGSGTRKVKTWLLI